MQNNGTKRNIFKSTCIVQKEGRIRFLDKIANAFSLLSHRGQSAVSDSWGWGSFLVLLYKCYHTLPTKYERMEIHNGQIHADAREVQNVRKGRGVGYKRENLFVLCHPTSRHCRFRNTNIHFIPF